MSIFAGKTLMITGGTGSFGNAKYCAQYGRMIHGKIALFECNYYLCNSIA